MCRYVENNPQYAECNVYLVKFRQLQVCLTSSAAQGKLLYGIASSVLDYALCGLLASNICNCFLNFTVSCSRDDSFSCTLYSKKHFCSGKLLAHCFGFGVSSSVTWTMDVSIKILLFTVGPGCNQKQLWWQSICLWGCGSVYNICSVQSGSKWG